MTAVLNIQIATSAAQLADHHRLRYQVYCLDRGFEPAEMAPDGWAVLPWTISNGSHLRLCGACDSPSDRPAFACGYTMRSGFRPDGLRRLFGS